MRAIRIALAGSACLFATASAAAADAATSADLASEQAGSQQAAVSNTHASATDTKPEQDAKAEPSGSVFLDPLGFLLFGPTLGVELGFGRFSAIAYGRWLDVGVLAKAMFLGDGDKFAFSWGAGLKGRYYFAPGLVGPHLGLALELLKTRATNDTEQIATNNLIVIPELEGGYRFGFGRFYLGATGGIGYAIQASKNVENINGGSRASLFDPSDVSTIYGSASIDVGFLF
jgi:hypothetical protein